MDAYWRREHAHSHGNEEPYFSFSDAHGRRDPPRGYDHTPDRLAALPYHGSKATGPERWGRPDYQQGRLAPESSTFESWDDPRSFDRGVLPRSRSSLHPSTHHPTHLDHHHPPPLLGDRYNRGPPHFQDEPHRDDYRYRYAYQSDNRDNVGDVSNIPGGGSVEPIMYHYDDVSSQDTGAYSDSDSRQLVQAGLLLGSILGQYSSELSNHARESPHLDGPQRLPVDDGGQPYQHSLQPPFAPVRVEFEPPSPTPHPPALGGGDNFPLPLITPAPRHPPANVPPGTMHFTDHDRHRGMAARPRFDSSEFPRPSSPHPLFPRHPDDHRSPVPLFPDSRRSDIDRDFQPGRTVHSNPRDPDDRLSPVPLFPDARRPDVNWDFQRDGTVLGESQDPAGAGQTQPAGDRGTHPPHQSGSSRTRSERARPDRPPALRPSTHDTCQSERDTLKHQERFRGERDRGWQHRKPDSRYDSGKMDQPPTGHRSSRPVSPSSAHRSRSRSPVRRGNMVERDEVARSLTRQTDHDSFGKGSALSDSSHQHLAPSSVMQRLGPLSATEQAPWEHDTQARGPSPTSYETIQQRLGPELSQPSRGLSPSRTALQLRLGPVVQETVRSERPSWEYSSGADHTCTFKTERMDDDRIRGANEDLRVQLEKNRLSESCVDTVAGSYQGRRLTPPPLFGDLLRTHGQTQAHLSEPLEGFRSLTVPDHSLIMPDRSLTVPDHLGHPLTLPDHLGRSSSRDHNSLASDSSSYGHESSSDIHRPGPPTPPSGWYHGQTADSLLGSRNMTDHGLDTSRRLHSPDHGLGPSRRLHSPERELDSSQRLHSPDRGPSISRRLHSPSDTSGRLHSPDRGPDTSRSQRSPDREPDTSRRLHSPDRGQDTSRRLLSPDRDESGPLRHCHSSPPDPSALSFDHQSSPVPSTLHEHSTSPGDNATHPKRPRLQPLPRRCVLSWTRPPPSSSTSSSSPTLSHTSQSLDDNQEKRSCDVHNTSSASQKMQSLRSTELGVEAEGRTGAIARHPSSPLKVKLERDVEMETRLEGARKTTPPEDQNLRLAMADVSPRDSNPRSAPIPAQHPPSVSPATAVAHVGRSLTPLMYQPKRDPKAVRRNLILLDSTYNNSHPSGRDSCEFGDTAGSSARTVLYDWRSRRKARKPPTSVSVSATAKSPGATQSGAAQSPGAAKSTSTAQSTSASRPTGTVPKQSSTPVSGAEKSGSVSPFSAPQTRSAAPCAEAAKTSQCGPKTSITGGASVRTDPVEQKRSEGATTLPPPPPPPIPSSQPGSDVAPLSRAGVPSGPPTQYTTAGAGLVPQPGSGAQAASSSQPGALLCTTGVSKTLPVAARPIATAPPPSVAKTASGTSLARPPLSSVRADVGAVSASHPTRPAYSKRPTGNSTVAPQPVTKPVGPFARAARSAAVTPAGSSTHSHLTRSTRAAGLQASPAMPLASADQTASASVLPHKLQSVRVAMPVASAKQTASTLVSSHNPQSVCVAPLASAKETASTLARPLNPQSLRVGAPVNTGLPRPAPPSAEAGRGGLGSGVRATALPRVGKLYVAVKSDNGGVGLGAGPGREDSDDDSDGGLMIDTTPTISEPLPLSEEEPPDRYPGVRQRAVESVPVSRPTINKPLPLTEENPPDRYSDTRQQTSDSMPVLRVRRTTTEQTSSVAGVVRESTAAVAPPTYPTPSSAPKPPFLMLYRHDILNLYRESVILMKSPVVQSTLADLSPFKLTKFDRLALPILRIDLTCSLLRAFPPAEHRGRSVFSRFASVVANVGNLIRSSSRDAVFYRYINTVFPGCVMADLQPGAIFSMSNEELYVNELRKMWSVCGEDMHQWTDRIVNYINSKFGKKLFARFMEAMQTDPSLPAFSTSPGLSPGAHAGGGGMRPGQSGAGPVPCGMGTVPVRNGVESGPQSTRLAPNTDGQVSSPTDQSPCDGSSARGTLVPMQEQSSTIVPDVPSSQGPLAPKPLTPPSQAALQSSGLSLSGSVIATAGSKDEEPVLLAATRVHLYSSASFGLGLDDNSLVDMTLCDNESSIEEVHTPTEANRFSCTLSPPTEDDRSVHALPPTLVRSHPIVDHPLSPSRGDGWSTSTVALSRALPRAVPGNVMTTSAGQTGSEFSRTKDPRGHIIPPLPTTEETPPIGGVERELGSGAASEAPPTAVTHQEPGTSVASTANQPPPSVEPTKAVLSSSTGMPTPGGESTWLVSRDIDAAVSAHVRGGAEAEKAPPTSVASTASSPLQSEALKSVFSSQTGAGQQSEALKHVGSPQANRPTMHTVRPIHAAPPRPTLQWSVSEPPSLAASLQDTEPTPIHRQHLRGMPPSEPPPTSLEQLAVGSVPARAVSLSPGEIVDDDDEQEGASPLPARTRDLSPGEILSSDSEDMQAGPRGNTASGKLPAKREEPRGHGANRLPQFTNAAPQRTMSYSSHGVYRPRPAYGVTASSLDGARRGQMFVDGQSQSWASKDPRATHESSSRRYHVSRQHSADRPRSPISPHGGRRAPAPTRRGGIQRERSLSPPRRDHHRGERSHSPLPRRAQGRYGDGPRSLSPGTRESSLRRSRSHSRGDHRRLRRASSPSRGQSPRQRQTGRLSDSEDDDLELLELKREAIMSMMGRGQSDSAGPSTLVGEPRPPQPGDEVSHPPLSGDKSSDGDVKSAVGSARLKEKGEEGSGVDRVEKELLATPRGGLPSTDVPFNNAGGLVVVSEWTSEQAPLLRDQPAIERADTLSAPSAAADDKSTEPVSLVSGSETSAGLSEPSLRPAPSEASTGADLSGGKHSPAPGKPTTSKASLAPPSPSAPAEAVSMETGPRVKPLFPPQATEPDVASHEPDVASQDKKDTVRAKPSSIPHRLSATRGHASSPPLAGTVAASSSGTDSQSTPLLTPVPISQSSAVRSTLDDLLRGKSQARSVSADSLEVPHLAPRLTAKTAELRRSSTTPASSRGSSRGGSRKSSPAPAVALKQRSGGVGRGVSASKPEQPLSVRIRPGDNKTWTVKDFCIHVSDDTSSEESDSTSSDEGDSPSQQEGGGRETMSADLDRLLAQCRKEVEMQEAFLSSSSSSSSASSSSPPPSADESPKLPPAVTMLPLQRQREYKELQRKLALHERQSRKRRHHRTPAVPGARAGSKECKFEGSKRLKLSQPSTAKRLRREGEEERERPRGEREEERERRQEVAGRERIRLAEERQREEEMRRRIADYELQMSDCRSSVERVQLQLTSTTHQLTECEAEIEEFELKVDLLSKQLQAAQSRLSASIRTRSELQNKVRTSKDEISTLNSTMRATSMKIAEAQEGPLHTLSGDSGTERKEKGKGGTVKGEGGGGGRGVRDMRDEDREAGSQLRLQSTSSVIEVEPISDPEVEPISDPEDEPGAPSNPDSQSVKDSVVLKFTSSLAQRPGARDTLSGDAVSRGTQSVLSLPVAAPLYTPEVESISNSESEDSVWDLLEATYSCAAGPPATKNVGSDDPSGILAAIAAVLNQPLSDLRTELPTYPQDAVGAAVTDDPGSSVPNSVAPPTFPSACDPNPIPTTPLTLTSTAVAEPSPTSAEKPLQTTPTFEGGAGGEEGGGTKGGEGGITGGKDEGGARPELSSSRANEEDASSSGAPTLHQPQNAGLTPVPGFNFDEDKWLYQLHRRPHSTPTKPPNGPPLAVPGALTPALCQALDSTLCSALSPSLASLLSPDSTARALGYLIRERDTSASTHPHSTSPVSSTAGAAGSLECQPLLPLGTAASAPVLSPVLSTAAEAGAVTGDRSPSSAPRGSLGSRTRSKRAHEPKKIARTPEDSDPTQLPAWSETEIVTLSESDVARVEAVVVKQFPDMPSPLSQVISLTSTEATALSSKMNAPAGLNPTQLPTCSETETTIQSKSESSLNAGGVHVLSDVAHAEAVVVEQFPDKPSPPSQAISLTSTKVTTLSSKMNAPAGLNPTQLPTCSETETTIRSKSESSLNAGGVHVLSDVARVEAATVLPIIERCSNEPRPLPQVTLLPPAGATTLPKQALKKQPPSVLPSGVTQVKPRPATTITEGATAVTKGATAITKGATAVTKSATAVTKGATAVTKGATAVTKGATVVPKGASAVTKSASHGTGKATTGDSASTAENPTASLTMPPMTSIVGPVVAALQMKSTAVLASQPPSQKLPSMTKSAAVLPSEPTSQKLASVTKSGAVPASQPPSQKVASVKKSGAVLASEPASQKLASMKKGLTSQVLSVQAALQRRIEEGRKTIAEKEALRAKQQSSVAIKAPARSVSAPTKTKSTKDVSPTRSGSFQGGGVQREEQATTVLPKRASGGCVPSGDQPTAVVPKRTSGASSAVPRGASLDAPRGSGARPPSTKADSMPKDTPGAGASVVEWSASPPVLAVVRPPRPTPIVIISDGEAPEAVPASSGTVPSSSEAARAGEKRGKTAPLLPTARSGASKRKPFQPAHVVVARKPALEQGHPKSASSSSSSGGEPDRASKLGADGGKRDCPSKPGAERVLSPVETRERAVSSSSSGGASGRVGDSRVALPLSLSPLSICTNLQFLSGRTQLLPTIDQGAQSDGPDVFASSFSSVLEKTRCVKTFRYAPPDVESRGQYTPYSSPLLRFRAYRLSGHYRLFSKLPITSLSYSNKIDPLRIMCRYEILGGACSDPKCSAQHLRQIQPSTEEVVTDLFRYAPTLVGKEAANQVELDESFRTLARGLVAIFDGDLTPEQIAVLATIRAGEALGSGGMVHRAVSSGGSFESALAVVAGQEPESLAVGRRDSCEGGVKEAAQSLLRAVYQFATVGGASSSARDAGHGSEVMGASRGLASASSSLPSGRYFSSKRPAPVQPTTEGDPSSPQDWIDRSGQALQSGDTSTAVSLLQEGLQEHATSEELWLELMRTKAIVVAKEATVMEADEHEAVLGEALKACPTPSVVAECVRQAVTYSAKKKWLSSGYAAIALQPQSASSSSCCLELLLNTVQLDISLGRSAKAMKTMETALSGRDPIFTALPSLLSPADLVFAHLCHLHLVGTGALPPALFARPPAASPPNPLRSKAPFLIPWAAASSLEPGATARVARLFHRYLSTGTSKQPERLQPGSMSPDPHLLPLVVNYVVFNHTHILSDKPERLKFIDDVITDLPPSFSTPELWLVLVQLAYGSGGVGAGRRVGARALVACPRAVEVYYVAANLELSEPLDASDRVHHAKQYLLECAKKFFNLSGQLSRKQGLMLYRKLLDQMVPYDYHFPPLAEGVTTETIKSCVTTLWLAYCLLIELSPSYILKSDFLHGSVEEAFESAVHSVPERASLSVLWKEYLDFLKPRSPTPANVKAYYDCVQRCLVAVDTIVPCTHPAFRESGCYRDLSFHDEVVNDFAKDLPPSASKMTALQKFHSLLPHSSVVVTRLAECAIVLHHHELAQSTLASFLSQDPYWPHLWKMAIQIELKLKRYREARWIFHRAVTVLPFSVDIWRDFMKFEFSQAPSSSSSSSSSPTSHISVLLAATSALGVPEFLAPH